MRILMFFIFCIPMWGYSYTISEFPNNTGEPIGGGKYYSTIYSKEQAKFVVENKSELLSALKNAVSGDIIFVEGTSIIDLTGKRFLLVKQGVTLASNRGADGSKGALLFTDEISRFGLIALEMGGGVTGLRIKGPTRRANLPGCSAYEPYGINIVRKKPHLNSVALISNNEIYQWPYAGVQVGGGSKASVFNNYIHDNRRSEFNNPYCNSSTAVSSTHALGYGVVIGDGEAYIEGNLFRYNRHDIAGNGVTGSSYSAKYNVSETGLMGHSFDMHGCEDRPDHKNCIIDVNKSGERIIIEDNVFLDNSYPAIVIRGNPAEFASIQDNFLSHKTSDSIRYEKDFIRDNIKDLRNESNIVLSGYWGHYEYDIPTIYIDLYNDGVPVALTYSYCGMSGENCWRSRKIGFDPESKKSTVESRHWGDRGWFSNKTEMFGLISGDFNGDGKEDIVYYGSCDTGYDCWRVHENKNESLESVIGYGNHMLEHNDTSKFKAHSGDFDNDGIDDLVYLGSCGSSSCLKILKSVGWKFVHYKDIGNLYMTNETFDNEVGIYDFNNDGKLDIGYYGACGVSGSPQWRYHLSSGDNYVVDCSKEKWF